MDLGSTPTEGLGTTFPGDSNVKHCYQLQVHAVHVTSHNIALKTAEANQTMRPYKDALSWEVYTVHELCTCLHCPRVVHMSTLSDGLCTQVLGHDVMRDKWERTNTGTINVIHSWSTWYLIQSTYGQHKDQWHRSNGSTFLLHRQKTRTCNPALTIHNQTQLHVQIPISTPPLCWSTQTRKKPV